jgi:glycerophosphoryl diester phosphodiesterase
VHVKKLKLSCRLLIALLALPACFSIPSPAQVTFKDHPLVIAHRGGSKEATENTVEAFQRAARLGADGNEMDIRLTRDGVIVVYHDDIFGRVEGLPRPLQTRLIADMTYAELQASPIEPKGGDTGKRYAPTLQDVLTKVKTGLLNIELKRCPKFDDLVDKTIAVLKASPEIDRIVLETPDLKTAEKLREALGPRLKLHINPGYDTSVPFLEAVEKVLKFKPHSLSVYYKKISLELVERAHAAGVEVWAWTLDAPEIAQALGLLRVDAIKTDTPTALINIFSRRH